MTARTQYEANLIGDPIAVKAVWHTCWQVHSSHWLTAKILSVEHDQI
jgi:hypothetical protein